MLINVLDAQYYPVGVIDEAESILWHKKYNDVGECEIYVPCNNAYLDLLRRGVYLHRYDDDMVCKLLKREIETDVENGDYFIAPATDLCTILAGRIVRWQVVYSGTVAGFIQKVLQDNVINPAQDVRKIPNFVFKLDTSNGATFDEKIEVSTFAEDLLQLIITTCKTHKYGFRLTYDISARQHVFVLYKGKNGAGTVADEYVEFSPQYANILSSHYTEDESEHKNVAYVGYTGTDGQTHLLSLYKGNKEPQGEARKEIYVDGTGVSRDITYAELLQMFPNLMKKTATNEDGKPTGTYYSGAEVVATSEGEGDDEKITVTDYTYLLLEHELGNNALEEHGITIEFSGTVDTVNTYIYREHYNLGDIVLVANEYGISAPARITEVQESNDNEDGYVVEPIFEFIN